MELKQSDKYTVYDEATILFEKVSDEYGIPRILTCIHLQAFCVANLVALYKNEGKKVPKELVNFLEKTYPKLLKDNSKAIELQYLALNTEGTA